MTSGSAPAPVFIVCNARSGSTLLRWLIDAHDEISCPGETDVAALFRHTSTRPRPSVCRSTTRLLRARNVIDDLMATQLAEARKTRWCDKSLSNVQAMDRLAEAWPEARFVLLHRHAMDVVASALEASEWGLDSFGLGQYAQMSPTNSVHRGGRLLDRADGGHGGLRSPPPGALPPAALRGPRDQDR